MQADNATLQNSGGARTQRVMIVEDEFLIALDISDTVEAMGLEVIGLANALNPALSLASQCDIAIIDVNLSDGRTGPEIGRTLARDFGVTVIFMTGNPGDIAQGVEGALGVLTKPVRPEVIERTLDYAICSRTGKSRAGQTSSSPPELRLNPAAMH